MKKTERLIWVDILKGVTISFVVIAHVLEGFERSLGGGYNVIAEYMITGIGIFHMPLFIAISGFIFSFSYLSINDNQKITAVIKEKKRYIKQICNLLLLYVIFSILIFGVKLVFRNWGINEPVNWMDFLGIPIKMIPNTPYWYLYVLSFLYIIGKWLFEKSWNKNFLLLILFALSCIYAISEIKGEVIIVRVVYYSFFFILGCLFHMGKYSFSGRWYLLCWLIGIIGIVVYLLWKGAMPDFLKGVVQVLTAAFIVNATMGTAQKYCKHQNIWSFFGQRCLEIYILHVFLTSGIRPVLRVLHMENYWLNVIIATFLGVTIPVICSYILKKLNLWTLFFKPAELIEKHFSKLKG
ncbi:MAG: acyltransferase [Eubacterium sp.]|nr:acyltransferase [Eubacterium sp.]